jgi:glutamate synthase domain-containing protein 2
VATSAAGVAAAVPFALDRGLAFLLLDGTGGTGAGIAWPELAGAPDLTAIRDTIRVMRALNREEDLEILWFGGVRSGTDVVKLLGLGANAAAVGVGLALAVGGRIEDGSVAWYGDVTLEERSEQAELYLQALRAEASIMPRCTGKTNIHNVEPEDLRSISLVTAEAAGVPLAGRNERLASE